MTEAANPIIIQQPSYLDELWKAERKDRKRRLAAGVNAEDETPFVECVCTWPDDEPMPRIPDETEL